MAEIGITLATFSGISGQELAGLAREAEEAGFGGVFIPEATNDALMCCLQAALATRRIKIASWIVNIYLREPYLCAAGAAMVQREANGRFILGLGVSHRPALEAMGIEMGNARERLRKYTTSIRKLWSGEGAGFAAAFPRPSTPIPIYYAALALETARLGGELADGLALYLCPPARMRKSIDAAREAARAHGRDPKAIAATCGVPVFLNEDREQAYTAARRGLTFYAALPFYNRLLARSGFEREAQAVMDATARRDMKAAGSAVSDAMIDSIAAVGAERKCVERVEQYRAAGAELPIVIPNPVGEDYQSAARRVMRVFGAKI